MLELEAYCSSCMFHICNAHTINVAMVHIALHVELYIVVIILECAQHEHAVRKNMNLKKVSPLLSVHHRKESKEPICFQIWPSQTDA